MNNELGERIGKGGRQSPWALASGRFTLRVGSKVTVRVANGVNHRDPRWRPIKNFIRKMVCHE